MRNAYFIALQYNYTTHYGLSKGGIITCVSVYKKNLVKTELMAELHQAVWLNLIKQPASVSVFQCGFLLL